MIFTFKDSLIAFFLLITIVILSCFGALFLIDIGFDIVFENYELLHYILLVVCSIIFIFIGMFFYDVWFKMRFN